MEYKILKYLVKLLLLIGLSTSQFLALSQNILKKHHLDCTTAYKINKSKKNALLVFKQNEVEINTKSAVDSIVFTLSDGNVGVHHYRYDSSGNLLQVNYSSNDKTVYQYDENNNIISQYDYIFENNNWLPIAGEIYQYDEFGNMISWVSQESDGINLFNIWREINIYENNIKIEHLTQVAINDTSWRNNYHEIYIYNNDKSLLELKREFWTIENIWEPTSKSTFSYNLQAQLSSTISETFKDDAWTYSSKYEYYYNMYGQTEREFIYEWSEDIWSEYMRVTYSYNDTNLISKKSEQLINDEWSNDWSYTYIYDLSEKLISEVFEDWANNQLLQSWRKNYTYDIDNNIVNMSYEEYQNSIWVIADGDLFFSDSWENMFYFSRVANLDIYYTTLPTSVFLGKQIKKFELFQNYPNPFNPLTNISFEVFETSKIKLSIYNLQGELISVLANDIYLKGQYQFLFNGEGLSSGVYYLRLVSEKYSKIIKMLLLK